ncbi:DNA polymerase III subunit epsilon [Actinomyces lilanjuaniae]|uniref:DNA polymerase III subunit epsilon n=1 Tax=Actinomyces lilanjuaniae TaxID=2321394 RepID=A0ABM6Z291_9ACTO|nr:exonuclease domain-containing protein [Actinomyces lilanjuaniae]AYD89356.1 DNA polymerase III subunit epsilon [Actinomyces lilanjuaniae]
MRTDHEDHSRTSRSHRPGSWTDGPLLGLDTETTGVDPARDHLVTAALVWRGPATGQEARARHVRTWLADPGVEIPEAAAAVHGITTEQARGAGSPPAQVLRELTAELVTALRAGTPVVVFNASFDLTLLDHELVRHHLPTLEEQLGHPPAPVVDPLVMDRAADRFRRGKRRLSDLCEVYGVTPDTTLHTAEVDVAATLDVLEAMVQTHPVLARLEVDELVAWQAREHRRWAESFNAWLARTNPSRRPVPLQWPVPEPPAAQASGRPV